MASGCQDGATTGGESGQQVHRVGAGAGRQSQLLARVLSVRSGARLSPEREGSGMGQQSGKREDRKQRLVGQREVPTGGLWS